MRSYKSKVLSIYPNAYCRIVLSAVRFYPKHYSWRGYTFSGNEKDNIILWVIIIPEEYKDMAVSHRNEARAWKDAWKDIQNDLINKLSR